jgi:periplasmic protein CpxP/Spy
MKRIFLSAALALSLTATLAIAQTATPPDSSSGPAPKGHYGHHHQSDPQQQAAFLAKRLNLTSDQQSKLEPILADRDQKIATLRSDTSLTPDQKKEQLRTIHQNTKQQLSSILTPEQMEQMKSFRGHRGSHHQGQPQTPPPSGL